MISLPTITAFTGTPDNDDEPSMRELCAHRPAPRAPQREQEGHGRMPLAEAITQGLFTREQALACDWWTKTHQATEVSYSCGGGWNVGGVFVQFSSRPADALFGAELAADRSMVLGRLYRLLGGLVVIIDAALDCAEMSELAPPQMLFPKEKRALAGRIRLGSALDIVARYSSDEGCSAREALEIKMAAADACQALAAKRRLRADNDNTSAAKKLAA